MQTVRVNDNERGSAEIITHGDICRELLGGRRCVLVGSPGGGKTTTMTQIAEKLLKDEKKAPMLVSLAQWAECAESILAFGARNLEGINENDLARLHRDGSLVFCFDGWNEVPASKVADMGRRLSQVDRDFSNAGIIVMTREHDTKPKLKGMLNLRLVPIDSMQRQDFIRAALAEAGNELLLTIERIPCWMKSHEPH